MTPVLWLLGLSGSGKTALGSLLRLYLEGQGIETAFIDEGRFCRQVDVAPEARIAATNALRDRALQQHAQGRMCIVAATTPYDCMRQKNRDHLPLYREVWVRCSLQTLVERDTRGLYAMAGHTHITGLCGLTDKFDEPRRADHVLDTDRYSLAESYLQLRDLALNALDEARHWQRMQHALLPERPLPAARMQPAIAL
ncbi:MAG: adenylyl-sulfate kinase [Desulfovibrio sp. MES5]|uniref:adenylyl-sulfate kinase n=1 Tax=Desulfovibrio sp. MES5 TaxID=1899016 RepID=UPI000B9CCD3F|nr:adenylyl-sulfate kinase [Desulfovibrio sp. MES5]OXS28151.1 MAG: adenylyl-sulfate kinase [Desulfovibrio sp. MES5]